MQPLRCSDQASASRQAFIAGTGLEHCHLHMSLEVLVLALGQMTQPGGFAAALPLTHRTAIASAASLLDDASKLAYRLTAAQTYPGQAHPRTHALSHLTSTSLRAICHGSTA